MLSLRRRGFRSLLARYKSYIFLSIVVVLFFHTGFYSGHNTHPDLKLSPVGNKFKLDAFTKAARMFRSSKGVITEHPIPKLMDNAEDKFRAKLKRQSKTLVEAVEEYKRRYERNPPRGFDEWWEFAKQNDVRMVDEFDAVVSDLEPFWKLSGEEIRRRTLQAGELPSIHLVRIEGGKSTTVKMNHAYEDSEVSARAYGFQGMIEKFKSKLPDMDFAINAKAEGRVLVSWEHQHYPNLTLQDSSQGIQSLLGGGFIPDWRNDENTWEAWRRTCPPNSPARKLYSTLRNPFVHQPTNYYSLLSSPSSDGEVEPLTPGSEFTFMSTTNAKSIDFCKQPHLHTSQGHFYSDWRSLPALYPIFTPAKAQGFMDIRIPSHYYYGSTARYTYGWDPVNLELKDVDVMEVPWEDKLDKVFWRGATTGGGSHPPGFAPQYQRHRFLRMTHPAPPPSSEHKTLITFADPPTSTTHYITTLISTSLLNTDLMDTAFVKSLSSDTSYPGGLTQLRKDHRFGDSVPLGEHWKYSDSVPVKASVYEEWFVDWIEPWVHYIPLSEGYKEIYNILAYFSGPTPSTLLVANSSSQNILSQNIPSSPKSSPSPSSSQKLSDYALAALQNQEVLNWSKEGRELLRNVDAERRLKRIARGGKEWKRSIGRKVDMEAYVYRLCLEWARLWADDRDSMDFKL
ncbi:Beta-1,2-xylosyltransferase 1 [Leucoagaricus sp. SymC.cos]|nr:Beta-1,2-xylosyltransferase 1 [Leucoagaricus sp. SymC.cos]